MSEKDSCRFKPQVINKALLFSLILAAGLFLSLFPTNDYDIWWHLKTGEWILQNHSLPPHDIFTYTINPEIRWYDVQWQFQIIVAFFHRLGGWNLLIALRTVWVLLYISILWFWLGGLGVSPSSRFLTTFLIILVTRFRFNVRPEILSLSLLAVQVWLYDRGLCKNRLHILPLLLIQFYWANWHSSCILGLFLCFVFCLSYLVKFHVRAEGKSGMERISIWKLGLFCCAIVMVTLMNRYGWVTPVYALTESNKRYILEFQSPRLDFFVGARGLILILSILGWRRLLDRGNLFFPILIPVFLFQSFRMIRFFPYLMVCLAPLLSYGISLVIDKTLSFRPLFRLPVVLVMIALLFFITAGNIHTDSKPMLKLGVDESTFPKGAVDFVLKEKIQGRMFNEAGYGGYLIWRMAPLRKVFIFCDTYLNRVLLERTMNIDEDNLWRELFDEYQVTYAIYNCPQLPLTGKRGTLSALILSWKDWKLVFWDDVSMVFVKDLPQYQDLIARRTSKILPEHIPFRDNPVPEIPALEKMFMDPRESTGVEKELLRAINDSPRHFRAAFALALFREINGADPKSVLDAYHAAESVAPDDPTLLQYLARWYFKKGLFEESIKYQKKALARFKAAPGYYSLALAEYQAGQYREAKKSIKKAFNMDPSNPEIRKFKEWLEGNHR